MSEDKTTRKPWPPDPSTCAEFLPDEVSTLQELDFQIFSQQMLERENTIRMLCADEVAKMEAKVFALEKEKADLAKKLDDARIHSKRQNEVSLYSNVLIVFTYTSTLLILYYF